MQRLRASDFNLSSFVQPLGVAVRSATAAHTLPGPCVSPRQRLEGSSGRSRAAEQRERATERQRPGARTGGRGCKYIVNPSRHTQRILQTRSLPHETLPANNRSHIGGNGYKPLLQEEQRRLPALRDPPHLQSLLPQGTSLYLLPTLRLPSLYPPTLSLSHHPETSSLNLTLSDSSRLAAELDPPLLLDIVCVSSPSSPSSSPTEHPSPTPHPHQDTPTPSQLAVILLKLREEVSFSV